MDADLTKFLEAMEGRLREHVDERTRDLHEHVDERTRDLHEYIDERTRTLRDDIREYVDERTHDAETRIVRAFGAYQESAGVRMRKIEADVSNINASTTQQLDVLQSKLLDLETRIINLEGPQG
ncbi:MAG: hypothetical protein WCC87_15670 [Candidatus Korobacteraceae bacterium]